jgi:ArsR family transcriptional regulator, zinc-responsive transcriptional repressor
MSIHVDSLTLLRLVSEATRHGLLQELRGGERTVSALVSATQDEQSNVSHHLSVLRHAGIVAVRREGRSQHYRLADAEVARLLEQVEALAGRMEQVAYTTRLGLPVAPGFQGYG